MLDDQKEKKTHHGQLHGLLPDERPEQQQSVVGEVQVCVRDEGGELRCDGVGVDRVLHTHKYDFYLKKRNLKKNYLQKNTQINIKPLISLKVTSFFQKLS